MLGKTRTARTALWQFCDVQPFFGEDTHFCSFSLGEGPRDVTECKKKWMDIRGGTFTKVTRNSMQTGNEPPEELSKVEQAVYDEYTSHGSYIPDGIPGGIESLVRIGPLPFCTCSLVFVQTFVACLCLAPAPRKQLWVGVLCCRLMRRKFKHVTKWWDSLRTMVVERDLLQGSESNPTQSVLKARWRKSLRRKHQSSSPAILTLMTTVSLLHLCLLLALSLSLSVCETHTHTRTQPHKHAHSRPNLIYLCRWTWRNETTELESVIWWNCCE